MCVGTSLEQTAAVGAGGRMPPKTVVSSYIALAGKRTSADVPLVVSVAAKRSDANGGGDTFADIYGGGGRMGGDRYANALRYHSAAMAEHGDGADVASAADTNGLRSVEVVDAASAALALQLLSHADGHATAKVRNTAGLLEDRMALLRGATLLSFLPPMQLPYHFLATMRRAEMAAINTFLLHSHAAVNSGGGGGAFAVEWEEDAEGDAIDVGAVASLYGGGGDNDAAMGLVNDTNTANDDGDETSAPPCHRRHADARELLRLFTAPQLAADLASLAARGGGVGGGNSHDRHRRVEDVVLLPTVLLPERAERGQQAANSFVSRALAGDGPRRGRGGAFSPTAAASSPNGAGDGLGPAATVGGAVVCGYGASVHSALISSKGIDTLASVDGNTHGFHNPYSPPYSYGAVVPYGGAPEDLSALAGATSLAAMWEEAGLSAYELAAYGAGRVGAVPLAPPPGVSADGHSSAYATATGRIAAANAPLTTTVARYTDPSAAHRSHSEGAQRPVAVAVLARQASRACQRLAPSFISQDLARQRLANVAAVARQRAREEAAAMGAHHSAAAAARRAKTVPTADPLLSSGSSAYVTGDDGLHLASALVNAGGSVVGAGGTSAITGGSAATGKAALSGPAAHGQRMNAGKRAFDHLLRVGRRRVEEADSALMASVTGGPSAAASVGPYSSSSVSASTSALLSASNGGTVLAAHVGRAFTGKPLVTRSAASSLLPPPEGGEAAAGGRGTARSAFSLVPQRDSGSAFAHSLVPGTITDSGAAGLAPSSLAATYGLDPTAAHSVFGGRSVATSQQQQQRLNASAPPTLSSGGVAATHAQQQQRAYPTAISDRVTAQEEGLERRLAVRRMARAIAAGHRAEGLAASEEEAAAVLGDPSNTMSLHLLRTLEPRLRHLTSDERQTLEGRALVASLGAACTEDMRGQLGGLAASVGARSRVRDVTAEVADTRAIEASLVGRKRQGRQEAKANDASLVGALQRLVADSSLDAMARHQQQQLSHSNGVASDSMYGYGSSASAVPYNTVDRTYNMTAGGGIVAPISASATGTTSGAAFSNTNATNGSAISTSMVMSGSAVLAAQSLAPPAVAATHDNRTLGFAHLMSRDRSAAYLA